MLGSTIGSTISTGAKLVAFAALVIAVFAAAWVLNLYEDRGDWYRLSGNGWPVAGAVFGSAIGFMLGTSALLDPKRNKQPLRYVIPAVVSLALLVFAGVRWFVPQPSLAGAQRAFEAADNALCIAELDLLEAKQPGEPGVAELRAKVEAITGQQTKSGTPRPAKQ